MASNANILNDRNVYAKVKDGVVTEYPVLPVHIDTRSERTSIYTICKFDTKPTLLSYQYLTEQLEVVKDLVLVHYTVVDRTLSQLLDMFKEPGSNITNPTPILIGAVTSSDLNKAIELVNKHVQTLLDDFAKTRGYDNINSAISYLNSTVIAYSTEAATALALRDTTWSSLDTYLAGVTAGTTPVPLKVTEIEAVLPTLVW